MKMRIVSLLLVLIMLGLVLVSCGTPTQASKQSPFDNRFATEHLRSYLYVIVDKVTGVCYLSRSDSGLTVLVDADGTPLTYSEAWYQVFGEGAP